MKRRCITVFKAVLLFVSLSIHFAYAAVYQSYQYTDNKLVIKTDEHLIELSALSQSAIEVLYRKVETPAFPSFAIDHALVNHSLVNPPLKSEVFISKGVLTYSLSNIQAVINLNSLDIKFYNGKRLLISEEAKLTTEPSIKFRFRLSPHFGKEEKLMGTGQRVLGMDRRGHKLPLYNRAHYGYTTESTQMNYSLPAVMSDKKYILLFDNTAKGEVDLAKTQSDILQFDAVGGRNAYIVFSGNTYPELINNYVNVTGKQPLPPRWAFGNHASRFGYKSQQQVLDTIQLYNELDIPVDSVILDLYWFGKDVKGHMGNLDWDYATFPNPIEMINQLKQQGVKTVLISEPFILTDSNKYPQAKQAKALAVSKDNVFVGQGEPKQYEFFFGHTSLVDVFSKEGQDWFGSIYQELARQGVEGVWGDLGEPEVHPSDMLHHLTQSELFAGADVIHNAYGHQWAKLVADSLREVQPDKRQFILMRSGFAGSQRYGLIPWTGDVSRSWGGLKPQVELSLQMSLFSLAYTHSDLGGFAGDNYDKEMYIRWLQYGAFQPIYRPHAQDAIPPEPVFHDKQTQDIIRRFIKLRYALLPYNYTLAYENSLTGMPLMRPMFFSDESNAELIAIKDQYFWGDSFLVKPITDPGVSKTKILLPPGKWFDYWSGKQYRGDREIEYPVNLETIPVLVKAGAIIPTVPVVNSTDYYSSEKLKLDYYYDSEIVESDARVYEDDGRSSDSLVSGKYELLHFHNKHLKQGNKTLLEFTFQRETKLEEYLGMPNSREVELEIHNWRQSSAEIKISAQTIPQVTSKQAYQNKSTGAYYDLKSNKLMLKFNWSSYKSILTVIKSD